MVIIVHLNRILAIVNQLDLIQNFKKHIELSKDEIARLMDLMHFKKLKKNEYIIQQDELACPLVLIKSGCLMTYHTDQSNEKHVIQFGLEMWWTGDLNSFTHHVSSMYSIKAITPSEVFLLDKALFEKMCQDIPNMEKYFRIIFQNSLVSHQKRIIRNISYSAEQKYAAFQEYYPKLELIIPQKYIASYLGITPEFLSKLRRRLSGK